jgi:Putative transposase/Transposase zinc-binding domain
VVFVLQSDLKDWIILCMLVNRGKFLRQIFADHWTAFVGEHSDLIRPSIHKNVEKMLVCGTEKAGFHLYKCACCKAEKKVAHTCKSRFCSSCGVRQTDMWIERYTTLFANCQYQHVIFSPPSEFRVYFRIGREKYFNALYDSVNRSLGDWYGLKGYIPGGMSVSHTFGRDLKWHVHIHVLITCGGLDVATRTKWVACNYLPHEFLKARFKQYFLENIARLWEKESIDTLPQSQRFLFEKVYQENIVAKAKGVTWYVHVGERLSNADFAVRYIGRYTKRPAIAESRIIAYDGKAVTYAYKEHRMTEQALLTVPVFDFIKRLIVHIPDTHFRVIRYFGFYANRVRGELLPKVFAILKQDYQKAREKLKSLGSWWRQRIEQFLKIDPLICSSCLIPLTLISVVYTTHKKSTL